MDSASVVSLDHVGIPPNKELHPLRDLVARALAHRPDVVLAKIQRRDREISAVGTAKGILLTLQGLG
jgi:hypothetical protein